MPGAAALAKAIIFIMSLIIANQKMVSNDTKNVDYLLPGVLK